VRTLLVNFLREEQGQDLVEYTMLLAFVVLASAGILLNIGSSLSVVWQDTSQRANEAASIAQAGTS